MKDIDDVLRSVGRESGPDCFTGLLAQATPAPEFLLRELKRAPQEKRSELADRFARVIIRYPPLEQEDLRKRMAKARYFYFTDFAQEDIDPKQALQVLDLDTVDMFKVGKLNHDKAREARIDWRQFLAGVLAKLDGRECGYYIKNDLWAWADEELRAKYPRERHIDLHHGHAGISEEAQTS